MTKRIPGSERTREALNDLMDGRLQIIPNAFGEKPVLGSRPALGRPFGHFSRHPDAPLVSPSVEKDDTDSRPLLEPPALALASMAGSRQPNFCCWLGTEVPTTSAPLLLYPQQQTFWTRLGMSQVDPKQS